MNVECPKCSGKNQVESTDREFLTCEYCRNTLYIDYDGIKLTFTYKSLISSEEILMYLRRDFKKTGFSENWRVVNSYPVYMPFWETGGGFLESASPKLKADKIPLPSGEKKIFDHEEMDGAVEKENPGSQPDEHGDINLYFLPFYNILINFKEKEYSFYVDALNGVVFGEPIPFFSAKDIGRYFPFFLLMFLLFFSVNFLINEPVVLIIINLVMISLFFGLSVSEMVRKLYGNEN